ncbi:MAG: hypothetical protein ACRDGM_04075 [bacterium]
MKLFGQLVRTVVNVATLPVAVVKDALTMGGTLTEQNPDYRAGDTYTAEALQRLKDEATL